jgi:hypothetical protein
MGTISGAYSAPILENTTGSLLKTKVQDTDWVSYSDSNALGWAGCGEADITVSGDASAFATIDTAGPTIEFYPLEEHLGSTYSFDLVYTN